MKLCFISDVHNKHNQIVIPECDILFDCGDWTSLGKKHEVVNYAKWFNKQPAKHLITCPGNHELQLEKQLYDAGEDFSSRKWFTDNCPRGHLLIHESIEIEGIKIFGSPWTPFYFNWSWNAGRTVTEAAHLHKPFIGDLWKDIPLDTQILITHGPSMGILDEALDYNTGKIANVGCAELGKKIEELKDLKIHAFGHLHLSGGKMLDHNGVRCINAAVCNDQYNPVNKIITIDY